MSVTCVSSPLGSDQRTASSNHPPVLQMSQSGSETCGFWTSRSWQTAEPGLGLMAVGPQGLSHCEFSC